MPIMQGQSSASIADCHSSISSVISSYWAGSYSASPITTNWPDTNGGANSLSPTGSPTWANNTFGTGLAGITFDGSTQSFAMTTATIPSISSSSLSVYAMVKIPSTGPTGYIFGSHNGGATNSYSLVFNGTGIEFDQQGMVALCTATYTFNASTIYEIAANYNGSTCTIYVNGSSVVSSASSHGSIGGADRVAAVNSPSFKGSMYELLFSSNGTYQSGAHTCWTGYGLP